VPLDVSGAGGRSRTDVPSKLKESKAMTKKKQSSSVAKRKAFVVARDAEIRRFSAILECYDAHFARMDIDHENGGTNAATAARIAALVDIEEVALDELVEAHVAFRQACEMRPAAAVATTPTRRKKKGK
jgi:hypothetical protein